MEEIGGLIASPDFKIVKNRLYQLSNEKDRFLKNLKAVGCLTVLMQKIGIKPVIVGGYAVELYTAGSYTTLDVDLVLKGSESAGVLLEALGFKKERGMRHWYHEELSLPIEIPDSVLAGSMDKLTRVEIDDLYVLIIGVEDLILDRLRAAVYWQSEEDKRWALTLLVSQWGEIDFPYLHTEALKEPSGDVSQLLWLLKKEADDFL